MDKNFFEELIEYFHSLSHITTDDIPNLELYMDQVTGFMDLHLDPIKRHHEDKALTKTMINNYAKNKLLPPPNKKRYNREHMLILLFIYYYKGILQLNDIEVILKPLNEKYFSGHSSVTLTDIYDEVFTLEPDEKERIFAEVENMAGLSLNSFKADDPKFSDLSDEDRQELQLFSFLCELGLDVFMKKLLMEKIADKLHEAEFARIAEERAMKKKK
ncbi:DUF1836 domain-containing protein [Oribacterium sp. WCC10]|uniref:DUF1836 domain-containing protein n=1 Tax=Oribacterium sp. WCC10 TaxID=1855343 RepID=UPI0008EC4F4A|nr:DUF1836 domain-containing protein [Oribacterium sp. WCC10]SFG20860.1 protein of unknown function [Oribacterium sp. WCC10]